MPAPLQLVNREKENIAENGQAILMLKRAKLARRSIVEYIQVSFWRFLSVKKQVPSCGYSEMGRKITDMLFPSWWRTQLVTDEEFVGVLLNANERVLEAIQLYDKVITLACQMRECWVTAWHSRVTTVS